MQGTLWHAMKAHYQLFAAAMTAPVRFDALGQRFDIASVVVVAVHKAQLGNMALGFGPVIDGVEDAGRGGARVLGVQRQNQNAVDAFFFQCIQLRRNRGLAVAHGRQHQNVVAALAQPAAQQGGLARSPVQQGRAFFFMPHSGVFGCRFGWSGAQDDAVQKGPPGEFRNLHHAVIAQKLGQIGAHGSCRRSVGRAQIAQQDGGAGGLVVTELRFGRKA